MRKTLTTAVLALALLAPGTAAFAASPTSHPNGSCNNGKGGNGATWNGHGGPAIGDSRCSGVDSTVTPPVVSTIAPPVVAPVEPPVVPVVEST